MRKGITAAAVGLLLLTASVALGTAQSEDCAVFHNHSGFVPGSYDYADFYEDGFAPVLGVRTNGQNINVPPPQGRPSWDTVKKCNDVEQETTTTTEQETTTTTQPEEETTTTIVEEETTTTVVVTTVPPPVVTTPPPEVPSELPFTGASSWVFALAGTLFLALGAGLVLRSRNG